jgi:hypothetical protein
MDRRILIAVGVLALASVVGYFALNLGVMTDSQDDLQNTANSANQQSCETVKKNYCAMGEVTESDYPDNCFEDGEHVLEDPYQCPQ